ncbi:hypothetical protein EDD85DRAFT_954488 [Armillaria nabsnona]|nr:hypothetical protein EDD85DRAFT_954488 [Armillaria nabsnona]
MSQKAETPSDISRQTERITLQEAFEDTLLKELRQRFNQPPPAVNWESKPTPTMPTDGNDEHVRWSLTPPPVNFKTKPLSRWVTIEEVTDEDEEQYLFEKFNREHKTAKERGDTHKAYQNQCSSSKLSSLMDEQIDCVISGHPKSRSISPRKSSSRQARMTKAPRKFVHPSDQIDPGSHLGKVLGGSQGHQLNNEKAQDDPGDSSSGDSSSSNSDSPPL